VLESYDENGGVYSALMTDTITVTVLPSECGQSFTHTFETSTPIVITKEYEPTIYFQETLFSGPNTYTVHQCGGSYSQKLVIDADVAGVFVK